ncbi:14068_t:CDS:2 [Gigaspora rosea]|nr:14068_t:CDS:2 [Gigaspora rosea]
MTIKEFFVKLTTGELSPDCNIDIINPETIERVEISKAQDATANQVSINCNIIEVTTSIRNRCGGWSTQSYANTQGKQFVTSLTKVIWYIDISLAPYATSSWMLKDNFNWLRNAFDKFIVTISNYVEFLHKQRDVTAINLASETPIRTADQATTVQIHKRNIWVTPVDKTKYYQLEQLLNDTPL